MDETRFEYMDGDGQTPTKGWECVMPWTKTWNTPLFKKMKIGTKYRRPIQPATEPAIKESLTVEKGSRIPSVERGCNGKANLGESYAEQADKLAAKHGKQYGIYRCPHCGGTHLTTKLEKQDQYQELLHVTKDASPVIKESLTTDGPSPAPGSVARHCLEKMASQCRINPTAYLRQGADSIDSLEREITALQNRLADTMSDYETAELRCKRVEERNAALAEEVRVFRDLCERAMKYGVNGSKVYSATEACKTGDEMIEALKQSRERLEKVR